MKFIHSKSLHLWLLSTLISMIAVVAMSYKWLSVNRLYGIDTNVVRNQSQLEDFLPRNQDTIEFLGGQKPYRIPTGFFIQSLSFVNSSDVNITGYIWQKYSPDFPNDFVKGIIFAEEVNSTNTRLDKFYESTLEQDGVRHDVIGWRFDVTVRQSFDYSHYPLDLLTVWLRLWYKDFIHTHRVILVPDFVSYAKMDKSTFGLDTEIVHGEWEIDETFFSYKDIPYDTGFGFSTNAEEDIYKELFINLGVRRKFINAFIVNLVPLFAVALLLFAQMLIVSGKEHLIERFGFNVNDSLTTFSALFFIILLAHIQVRSQFTDSGLVYIEYFYLIMYLAVIFCAANLYIFSLGRFRYLGIIYYRDNLIPKLAYWPTIIWSMTTATWLIL